MTSDNDQTYPVKETPSTYFKLLKPLAILSIVFLIALVSGMSGYLLGVRTRHNVPHASQKVLFQQLPTGGAYAPGVRPNTARIPTISRNQPTLTAEPLATITPVLCPPALSEGDPSQPYKWKTYACPALGVSFLYPANLTVGSRGFVVVGQENSVAIRRGEGYMFNITKFTSASKLQSMWPLPTGELQTSFHGYPAYLQQETAETAGQVAENFYIVRVSPTANYVIEYEIPDPRASTDPAYRENEQKRNLLTSGMQKILDSIVFFTDQE